MNTMTIIQDKDAGTDMLVNTDTGEVVYERTSASDLPPRRTSKEQDPMILGHWLMNLKKAGARLLFILADKIADHNAIAGDLRLLAEDAGMDYRTASRGLQELRSQGIIRGSGTTAFINPTVAWRGPYGLSDHYREQAVQLWYAPTV